MQILILGANEQYETKVDDKHYPSLIAWRWTFKISSRKYKSHVYGRRCISVEGKKKTILLSHVVLELSGRPRPSLHHTADHINNDTLDDREENLRWATKRQQSRNQRRYKSENRPKSNLPRRKRDRDKSRGQINFC